MKRIGLIVISLMTVAALLLISASCSGKTQEPQANLMQGIFEKLTANEDYLEWKSGFSSTTIEEKLDGDSIVVSAEGEEGVNGDYSFTLDGDYIVNVTDEGDYTGYSIMMFIKKAVADYYGMNDNLMTGYISGLQYAEAENKVFITEKADGKNTTKLYAAGIWEMDGLDDMYVGEESLEYCDELGENPISFYVNAGRITAASIGSADQLDLMVGEYGENTDKTLKAILTIINKQKPDGYEKFISEYTELKEVSGDGYSVSFGIPEEVAANHEYKPAEGYKYVTIVFSAETPEAAEEANG